MATYSLVDGTTQIVTVGTDMALVAAADVDNPVEGDLALANGSLFLVSDLAAQVAQGITIKARFFFAEWFLDTAQGMPYFEKVFVKAPSLFTLNSLFSQLLLSVPGVASVRKLLFNHQKPTRTMVVTYAVVLTDGTILPGAFKPFILQNFGAPAVVAGAS